MENHKSQITNHKQIRISKIIISILFVIWCLGFGTSSAHAFSAEVVVDTGGNSINALEATILIPEGVKIDAINNGNSAVLFWIEAPTYDDHLRSISFSGITPGGFQGKERVLTLSGEFATEDFSHFLFSNVQALKNDGLGTPALVKFSLEPTEITRDVEPPESFVPLVGRSADLFDGQYFLVFMTQDKGVGIDHYEVNETANKSFKGGTWVRAESPYLLTDQTLHHFVFVRAIDRAQNVRMATLAPVYPQKFYQSPFFWLIIVMVFSTFLFLKRRLLFFQNEQ